MHPDTGLITLLLAALICVWIMIYLGQDRRGYPKNKPPQFCHIDGSRLEKETITKYAYYPDTGRRYVKESYVILKCPQDKNHKWSLAYNNRWMAY